MSIRMPVGMTTAMCVELDIPEFPYEEPPSGITCAQKPWNGVLVQVDRIPFKAGDEVTFHITVCGDIAGHVPAAETQGVVSIAADTTSADWTIPWDGVLDRVTEGSVIAFYTLAPADGGAPSTSQEAIVRYSRQHPGGGACGADAPEHGCAGPAHS
ncbi:hypothetical protein [Streptomyces yangpuensis]|uniref:hypothetical protein n=1 Tax=Streptomyces yangpuensis TaxID=1648182 RepID=UPI0037112523